ncbi:MAG TPA: hypothetical protein VK836_03305 [Streptosporangiaceae bacterium]|nr:hypothetical protein [Streptosporangiaceae bacterium]
MARPASRSWWVPAAWIAGGLALFAFLLRISLSVPLDSDGANNALQGLAMLHGNFLLHGFIIGDATFYTFELPLFVITEVFFGLHSVTVHLVAALTYLIVAACAVAVGVTGSRGPARAARGGVLIAVLAAPLLTPAGVGIVLGKPDHTGTCAILLICLLLIDRAVGRAFTPPLLCAILCAGQLGDATVRYVGVPAVILVCGYRALVARKLRTADVAIVVAAAVSAPLASLIRAVMLHFGAYLMIPPRTAISPSSEWPQHAIVALRCIRVLFGTYARPDSTLGVLGAAFGMACLVAAAFGFAKVVWRWRTASRAEQVLCTAIVINIGAYIVSTMPSQGPSAAREIVALLPCGAVLAARACVPAHIADGVRARVAMTTASLVALVPLTAAAAIPPAKPDAAPLARWLEAHGLRYGIAGYWDASAVTVESDNLVQVRAINPPPGGGKNLVNAAWESDPSWYSPSRHDATFAIAEFVHADRSGRIPAAVFERYLGRPVAAHRVAGVLILIYQRNLLKQIKCAMPYCPGGKSAG